MFGKELDKGSLARQIGGIWDKDKDKDVKKIGSTIRRLRKGKRIKEARTWWRSCLIPM